MYSSTRHVWKRRYVVIVKEFFYVHKYKILLCRVLGYFVHYQRYIIGAYSLQSKRALIFFFFILILVPSTFAVVYPKIKVKVEVRGEEEGEEMGCQFPPPTFNFKTSHAHHLHHVNNFYISSLNSSINYKYIFLIVLWSMWCIDICCGTTIQLIILCKRGFFGLDQRNMKNTPIIIYYNLGCFFFFNNFIRYYFIINMSKIIILPRLNKSGWPKNKQYTRSMPPPTTFISYILLY